MKALTTAKRLNRSMISGIDSKTKTPAHNTKLRILYTLYADKAVEQRLRRTEVDSVLSKREPNSRLMEEAHALGRNFFRLGGYSVVNLSLGKVRRLAWNHSLELRVEMQNAFNSKRYEEPASIRTNSGVFGAVDAGTVVNFCCSPGSNPRTIQLAAKYIF
jgi:hypothetical protein